MFISRRGKMTLRIPPQRNWNSFVWSSVYTVYVWTALERCYPPTRWKLCCYLAAFYST